MWDITCDSDGEISFDIKNPLFLHDVNLEEEDYFLAFFLVGAYQETMGIEHNLFSHPTEVSVEIDEDGYAIKDITLSKSISRILKKIGYEESGIREKLLKRVYHSDLIDSDKKSAVMDMIDIFLNDNGYLKTDIIQPEFFTEDS